MWTCTWALSDSLCQKKPNRSNWGDVERIWKRNLGWVYYNCSTPSFKSEERASLCSDQGSPTVGYWAVQVVGECMKLHLHKRQVRMWNHPIPPPPPLLPVHGARKIGNCCSRSPLYLSSTFAFTVLYTLRAYLLCFHCLTISVYRQWRP